MYDAVKAGGSLAIFYYVIWIVIGAYVLLNLLLVIILDVYVEEAAIVAATNRQLVAAEEAAKDGEGADEEGSLSSAAQAAQEEAAAAEAAMGDKSLGLFSLHSAVRKLCMSAATHPVTDQFIMVVIVANCITMALDTPDLDKDSTLAGVLFVADLLFTGIFIWECATKVIAFSLVKGKEAYLQDVPRTTPPRLKTEKHSALTPRHVF